ncbi:hypothetical protein C4K68_20040 [Pokkaliibacter plantistimulans]|uniref:HTH lysR-type domain-containing protein n=1 Tax=Proteobacteria bacterium 228 TaxID=2083153 RepID=A0A2S5KLI6_9PROT|nr:LysR family transcriptional regulator [Pokkaliibacter plantistimulans]PPC75513.1 hypothetical protein C4K68_20040 [Pokkaliibacter plantistimulans]
MDPKHLMYLAVILDKGSITAASKHLHVAQPTLTRIIATLEMQAGTQLFTRSRFGVQSTSMGEVLAREGRAIQRNMEIAREQVSRFQLGLREQLRIATGPLIGIGLTPEIIRRVSLEKPRTVLNVTSESPAAAWDGLLDDRYDIAIMPAPNNQRPAGIQRRLLADDYIGIYCGEQHPLAGRSDISIRDYESADWLSLGMSAPFIREAVELLTAGGIKNVRTKVVFKNDGVMLLKTLSQGMHLAVLPNLPLVAARDFVRTVELKPLSETVISRPLYLWFKDEIQHQPEFVAFEKIAMEVFNEFSAG